MSNDQHNIDDQPEDMEIQAEESPRRRSAAGNAIIGWVISGLVHGMAVVLAMFAVFGAPPVEEIDVPPTRINPIAPPEKPPEQPKTQERTLEAKIELDTTQVADKPNVQTPVENPQPTPETPVEAVKPVGREEATGTAELGGSNNSGFMAIGAGGGAGGAFGMRTGGSKKKAILKGGASKRSEAAVEKSLQWFKRHQSPNGGWEVENYHKNCTDGTKCEPVNLEKGRNEGDVDVAATGYAVLCYLGAGYEHRTMNQYRSVVKKGIDFLLSKQGPDGIFGKRNYEHPIAIMALAEAYAMTGDQSLRGPTQKGIDRMLTRQIQDKNGTDGYSGPLGWDYINPTASVDSSVTGWNVMALKSALAAGFNVGRGWDGSKKWLELHWKAANPSWQSLKTTDKSIFSYRWGINEKTGAKPAPAPAPAPVAKVDPKDPKKAVPAAAPAAPTHSVTDPGRECIGLVCGIFLGRTAGDVIIETLANTVMAKQVPGSYPTNLYYMYYNTMGIFQLGNERWTTWNAKVRDTLVDAQRKDNNCFDGSWDFEGTGSTGKFGRLFSTAYCTLSLEVYYRYAQVKDLHH